mmetsp:Transcript_43829/g.93820  ORF Transcript_43829/g.93820 Transcript_43829/m.93820 type:complete len:100 (+) Transcript_43829:272-571(+)
MVQDPRFGESGVRQTRCDDLLPIGSPSATERLVPHKNMRQNWRLGRKVGGKEAKGARLKSQRAKAFGSMESMIQCCGVSVQLELLNSATTMKKVQEELG